MEPLNIREIAAHYRALDALLVGGPGVVSEILSGKRELNVRHVRALAERFGLGAEAFLQG